MTYQIYAVKDALVAYNTPFILLNEDVAKREFRIMLEHTDEIKRKDLSLWKLGTFEDETGTIVPMIPEMVVFGKE